MQNQSANSISNSYDELECVETSDIRDLIEQCLNCKINLLIYGEPGCGKSQIIEELASDGSYNLVQLGAASLCEEAINGFPTKEDASTIVKYTMPEWLATIEANYAREPETPQILFIDELTLATPEVMNSLQILLTARALPMHASHKLPDNVVIVSATNTAEDSNEGNELSRPLKTRFMTVRMRNTPENYMQYIFGRVESGDLMQHIVQVLGEDKTRLFIEDSINDFRNFWCDNTRFYGTNPRTIMNYYNACDYVAKTTGKFTSRDAQAIARRTVGHSIASTRWENCGQWQATQGNSNSNRKKLYPTDEELSEMDATELQNLRADIMDSTKSNSAAAITTLCKINTQLFERAKTSNE